MQLNRTSTFSSTTASIQSTPPATAGNVDEHLAGTGSGAFAQPSVTPTIRTVRSKASSSDNGFEPIATIDLAAEIPDIILSKDRRWVYLLNASEGAVERIDTQTLALDGKSVKTVQAPNTCD